MTIGQKIGTILVIIALSIAGAMFCHRGIDFIRESVNLAGAECIRYLLGGGLIALISVILLWVLGIAGYCVITTETEY